MLLVSPEWLLQEFPELALMENPADPGPAELEFYVAQQNKTRLGLLPSGRPSEEPSDPVQVGSIWPAFRTEFHEFVCTDSAKYASIRNALTERGKVSDATILSAITAGIAAVLGVIAAALVPFVALLLYALARLGKETYCTITTPGANRTV